MRINLNFIKMHIHSNKIMYADLFQYRFGNTNDIKLKNYIIKYCYYLR